MLIGARVVATVRIFDLDDACTEIGKRVRAGRPRHHAREIHDQQTFKCGWSACPPRGTFRQFRFGGHLWRSLTSACARRISCKTKLKARHRRLRKYLIQLCPKTPKRPGSNQAAGPFDRTDYSATEVTFRLTGNPTIACLFEPLSPIQRIRPSPGHIGFIEPITCLDEIIGRHRIVRRVRNNAVPSNAPAPCLDRAHQPELKAPSPMPRQDPDPGEVTAIAYVRRRDHAGERHRVIIVIGKPPGSEPNCGTLAASKNVSRCRSVRVSATSSSYASTIRILYMRWPIDEE